MQTAFATPTQLEAHQRRQRFLRSIEAKAVKKPTEAPVIAREPDNTEHIRLQRAMVLEDHYMIRAARDGYWSNATLPPTKIDAINERMARHFEIAAENGLTTRPKIERIIRAVSTAYGLSKEDILSRRRTKNIVLPRQIAMYVAKQTTLHSLPEIGRRFGGRDHTTVLHAVRKIERLIPKDTDVEYRVTRLIKSLKPRVDE